MACASEVVREVTGAATTWVHERISTPAHDARVVHSGPDAVYIDDGGVCLAVLSRSAIAVPCGVRTILDGLDGFDGGQSAASVGGGKIVVGSLEVSVTRYVDARVLQVDALPTVEVTTDELPPQALAWLAEADCRCVPMLLGRGSGLTPLGDDVLCGWLAARVALGLPHEPISTEVRRLAHRTTILSATLLDCAARGEVVPQFGDLLRGCASLNALLGVGHTSGLGLAIGLSLAA